MMTKGSRIGYAVVLLAMISIFTGCRQMPERKRFVIGFSQCTGAANWRKATLEGLEKEMSFHPGSRLLYRNAGDNSTLQIAQIRELMQQHIDILLVSPNEAEPLTPVIEEVYRKGIPVVVIDRRTSSDKYSSFVGVDNYEIGRMAARYIGNQFPNGQLQVVEVLGLPGSTPAGERSRGFRDGLSHQPNLKLRHRVYGNWLEQKTETELSAIQDMLQPADIVFAQNDPMALGAHHVYTRKGWNKSAQFIGVDGLSGDSGGVDLVAKGILKATLLNPPGGEEALQIGFKILTGQPYERENILQTLVIDSSNVRIMTLQADRIRAQQKDIQRQQAILSQQLQQYDSQRNIVYLLLTVLILVLTLGGIILFALRANRKINRSLQEKNSEILQNEKDLIALSKEAQTANDAKLQFFTNISHEFRTPLTLILSPLEEAIQETRPVAKAQAHLKLVHKNVIRLMRMVNQLMDFRKIELGKLQMRPTENDFVAFVKDITDSFRNHAQKKQIDFQLILQTTSVRLWFDVNMIDKVLFNLLANAFKFTAEHGFVHVTLIHDVDLQQVRLQVADNGIGMTREEISQAFDQFYQGDFANYKGTGLGLALSKELVQLHQGEITIQSEKGKGTVFTLVLKTGVQHLPAGLLSDQPTGRAVLFEEERIYLEHMETAVVAEPGEPREMVPDQSILVIEDHSELRKFLAGKLAAEYDVFEAGDSKTAIDLALGEVPDLIICDLVIPGKTGIDLTRLFKSDVRTSHIPIILLTAKADLSDQINGMKSEADAYITKPFNLLLLQETIKSLLANRARLRLHYSSDLPVNQKTTASKLDKKFVIDFKAYIDSNLSNDGLTVEEICRAMCVSKVQLYRKVKALLDYNVNDYLLHCRLQRAKYYLLHEDYTMAEVAEKSGFSSAAYFSTVFKTKTGVTPTAFKTKTA